MMSGFFELSEELISECEVIFEDHNEIGLRSRDHAFSVMYDKANRFSCLLDSEDMAIAKSVIQEFFKVDGYFCEYEIDSYDLWIPIVVIMANAEFYNDDFRYALTGGEVSVQFTAKGISKSWMEMVVSMRSALSLGATTSCAA